MIHHRRFSAFAGLVFALLFLQPCASSNVAAAATPADAAAAPHKIRSGLYAGGDRLENHISDRTSTALSTYMRATGRSEAPVSLLKPWFLALHIRGEELRVYGLSATAILWMKRWHRENRSSHWRRLAFR
jgi:hypothetical protein